MSSLFDKSGNPMNIIEKIVQTRIFRNRYWKEHCFGLTEETLAEKAMDLEYIGGTFGGTKTPTPFLCLVLAMLHMQPEQAIVIEFILNEEYKYVRALGAFYLRITGSSMDIYQYLEPLYMDFRKLRKRTDTGFIHVYMDNFINELLSSDNYSCDISLPFLSKRIILEETKKLKPRISPLQDSSELENAIAELGKRKRKYDKDNNDKNNSSDSDSDSDNLESQYKERIKRERWKDKRMDRNRSPSPKRRKSSYRSPERRLSNRSRERRSEHYSTNRRRSYYDERSRSRSRDRYKSSRNYSRRDRRRSRSRSRSRDHNKRNKYYNDSNNRNRNRNEKNDNNSSPPRKKTKSSGGEISMSIEETNKMRASLGLPPLK